MNKADSPSCPEPADRESAQETYSHMGGCCVLNGSTEESQRLLR